MFTSVLSLWAVGAALSLSVLLTDAAKAVNITQGFRVDIESGSLAGQTFTVVINFSLRRLAAESVAVGVPQSRVYFAMRH